MKEQAKPLICSGASAYYTGDSGSRYFAWQNSGAECTAKITALRFQPYVKASDSVLDFGCGAGHVLRSLECARRVGFDVNPAACAAAREAGIECYDSVSEVPDESFEVIISHHALEHVEHPVSVLRTLHRWLAPGGTLVLCLPIDDWRAQRVYLPQDINHHLHTWTPQLLGNSLCEAGFTPERFSIRILTDAWFPGMTRISRRTPALLLLAARRIFSALAKRRQLLAVARKG